MFHRPNRVLVGAVLGDPMDVLLGSSRVSVKVFGEGLIGFH